MTSMQTKIASVIISALTAALICYLTAVLGGAKPQVAIIGALLSLLKDLHSFTSTAPKNVEENNARR